MEEKQTIMGKISNFLVEKRIYIFGFMMVFLVACMIAIPNVNTTTDFASFLPEDSSMRHGLEIMDQEWQTDGPPATRSFLIMIEGATSLQTDTVVLALLNDFAGINNVITDSSSNFNQGQHRLMIISTNYTNINSARSVMSDVVNHIEAQGITVTAHLPGYFENPMDFMLPIAILLMALVLFLMCESYFDPILIFAGLGAAVIFNMGSNIIFSQVLYMTTSVASVLQLMLSIVCTLILLTRYRQEKRLLAEPNPKLAMKNAIKNSTKTILSACTATFIGLLSLMLMSFGVGQDMGMVFSKGVFFTVVSLYTVMPTLIILCDKILCKTDKANIKAKRKAKSLEKRGA
ncbi:MAG: MMPL family transporter [Erysipelotrichales bacterium]|nr:MMPL family transporter [Erysipelotrichales bacterium]